jgi:hypothetical protein
MPNKLPEMKLSRDEEVFLKHWIYDEAHYQEGRGAAKQLQVEHSVVAADLALLVAAAIPDPEAQVAAASSPAPSEPPTWPRPGDTWAARVAEARAILEQRRQGRLGLAS